MEIASDRARVFSCYLKTAGVLQKVLFEEQRTAGDVGQVRPGARRHHDARFDLERRGADVLHRIDEGRFFFLVCSTGSTNQRIERHLKLDDARVVRIAPRVQRDAGRPRRGGHVVGIGDNLRHGRIHGAGGNLWRTI